jgi:hypothetical protein
MLLLCNPFRSPMVRHIKVQDIAAAVSEHDKHILENHRSQLFVTATTGRRYRRESAVAFVQQSRAPSIICSPKDTGTLIASS